MRTRKIGDKIYIISERLNSAPGVDGFFAVVDPFVAVVRRVKFAMSVEYRICNDTGPVRIVALGKRSIIP